MHKARIKIYGMDCPSCSSSIERITRRTVNVESAKCNYLEGTLYVEYRGYVDFSLLSEKLLRCGYRLLEDTVSFSLPEEGIKLKDEFLSSFEGAVSWEKDERGDIKVRVIRTGDSEGDIIQFFNSHGFCVTVLGVERGEETLIADSQVEILRNLVISVLLTFPLLWGPSPYIQVVLGTLIELFPARRFFRGMVHSIKGKSLNMDTLIALSTSVIYLFSTYTAFTAKEDIKLYFLCQGVLVSMLLFGRYLECVAKGETTRSLRRLMNLIPRKARVLDDSGTFLEKDISLVKRKERIVIEKGERIPLDGIVIEGGAFVDESVMTGESALVRKEAGDSLISGTIIRDGNVVMEASSTNKDSAIEHVVEIVRNATAEGTEVREKTDRVASIFIPVVIAISIAVFLLWYFLLSPGDAEKAVLTASGVLVVACPCALGLAVETSIMVGCGRAAEMGILFKTSAVFSTLKKIDTVAVDKTGTLTTGVKNKEGEEIRPGAKEFISLMKKRALDIVLITGDTEERALRIAERLGIKTVYHGVKSSDKASIIRGIENDGRKVLMVGDGVNDAPGMAVADVGISIENGTEIAKDTADIIILNDEIEKVEDVFEVSEKINANIRANLVWALIYNAVAIPLASFGFMNPSIASAAMSFSSIAVLLNSLRLGKMKVGKKEL